MIQGAEVWFCVIAGTVAIGATVAGIVALVDWLGKRSKGRR